MTRTMTISPLLKRLCDDAALFPPGNAPLGDALPAHDHHLASNYAGLVGPFVFPAGRLSELATAEIPVDNQPAKILDISLTVPGIEALADATLRLRSINRTRLAAIELAPADDDSVSDVVSALAPFDVPAYVEIPRDDRRPTFIDGLAGTGIHAKFRTGGVSADKYPDENELAAAIRAVIDGGIAFKATAGMHYAIRNTDAETGFEQHGFLNVLLAVHRGLDGAGTREIAEVLANRDGQMIASTLQGLDAERQRRIRSIFRSFGTCSIADPLADLTNLQLYTV